MSNNNILGKENEGKIKSYLNLINEIKEKEKGKEKS